jgi:hypothetical protein
MALFPMRPLTLFAIEFTMCTSTKSHIRTALDMAPDARVAATFAVIKICRCKRVTMHSLVFQALLHPKVRLGKGTMAVNTGLFVDKICNLANLSRHVATRETSLLQGGLFEPIVRLEGRRGMLSTQGAISFLGKEHSQFFLSIGAALRGRKGEPFHSFGLVASVSGNLATNRLGQGNALPCRYNGIDPCFVVGLWCPDPSNHMQAKTSSSPKYRLLDPIQCSLTIF